MRFTGWRLARVALLFGALLCTREAMAAPPRLAEAWQRRNRTYLERFANLRGAVSHEALLRRYAPGRVPRRKLFIVTSEHEGAFHPSLGLIHIHEIVREGDKLTLVFGDESGTGQRRASLLPQHRISAYSRVRLSPASALQLRLFMGHRHGGSRGAPDGYSEVAAAVGTLYLRGSRLLSGDAHRKLFRFEESFAGFNRKGEFPAALYADAVQFLLAWREASGEDAVASAAVRLNADERGGMRLLILAGSRTSASPTKLVRRYLGELSFARALGLVDPVERPSGWNVIAYGSYRGRRSRGDSVMPEETRIDLLKQAAAQSDADDLARAIVAARPDVTAELRRALDGVPSDEILFVSAPSRSPVKKSGAMARAVREALGADGGELPGMLASPELLGKRRTSRKQVGLSRYQRLRNAARSIYMREYKVPATTPVDGWVVVLVDDVYTSSATASASIAVLMRRGARRVVRVAGALTGRAPPAAQP